jgi:hypothetical protein
MHQTIFFVPANQYRFLVTSLRQIQALSNLRKIDAQHQDMTKLNMLFLESLKLKPDFSSLSNFFFCLIVL